MRLQQEVSLFAPGQAVSALNRIATDEDQASFERIKRLDLVYGGATELIEFGDITVEAVMIPHSGWPSVHQNVENLSYRVTLNDELTVVHMGDADPDQTHFLKHELYWVRRETHAAFPPYWFFLVPSGIETLDQFVRPSIAIGTHIPADPEKRERELNQFDVFTIPGETRQLNRGKLPLGHH